MPSPDYDFFRVLSIDHSTGTGVEKRGRRKALTRTEGQDVAIDLPVVWVGELTSHVEYSRTKYSHVLP